MSGIYIHIPFCKQRCHYCDFFTTTQMKFMPEMVNALRKEIQLRKNWLQNETISTIYFGGGTPSLLSVEEITMLIEEIHQSFKVDSNPEITIEANPDDLSLAYINKLSASPVNRLSIGIQSFDSLELKLMNRRHSVQQAKDCVKQAQEAGFDNISVDLIYGLPESTPEKWQQNLEQVTQLNIQHLSAYHLTYEQGTVFETWNKKNKIFPVTEEESIAQFNMLIDWATKNNLNHYEISNFGKEGCFSKHNTNYWHRKKYLGIGPAAHSYDIETRAWNPSNIEAYLEGIKTSNPAFEIEYLSNTDKYNEYLITSIRTSSGIDLAFVEKQFGAVRKRDLEDKIKPFIETNKIQSIGEKVFLTREGIFISDLILTELIIDSEETDEK
jgi:oxygen-independent coproporphyrinogen-3 oxidase